MNMLRTLTMTGFLAASTPVQALTLYQRRINLMKKCVNLIPLLLLFSSPAFAEQSVIRVPLAIPLSQLQAYANQKLPVTLDERSEKKQCVKPKEKCVKIPEFRGFKIYSRTECVRVVPAINCNVNHRVWREGPLRISGSGGTLRLDQVARASATVRGRGAIGKNIRETLNGGAAFTITASPRIAPNWSLKMPVDVNFRWTTRPNARLFGVIPITFGSQAGNKLNDAIAKFKRETLPTELKKIQLKATMSKLWNDLQEPHALKIDGAKNLRLYVRPNQVGYTPFSVSNGVLSTALSIGGDVWVSDNLADAQKPKTSLPNLSAARGIDTLVFVPLPIGAETLTVALNKRLPASVVLPQGKAVVQSADLILSGQEFIVDIKVSANLAGFSTYTGGMRFKFKPQWNGAAQSFGLNTQSIKLLNSSFSAGIANTILQSRLFVGWLDQQLIFPMKDLLAKAERDLNNSLSRDITGIGRLKSNLRLSISRLKFANGLLLNAKAEGQFEIVGLELLK